MRRIGAMGVLFAIALSLYLATMQNGVQPADSGEFQLTGWVLGVPHAPGYPLFTLLTHALAHGLPFGSVFWRMGLLSALAASATLVCVAGAVKDFLPFDRRSRMPGLLAALALGTSSTFWSQATTVNVRSLTALFTAAAVWAFARVIQPTASWRAWVALGLAIGLGVGHHLSLVLPLGILLLAALLHTLRRLPPPLAAKPVRLPVALLALVVPMLLTQLIWLYLPWRDASGAAFAPGSLNTLEGLWFHISGAGFEGDQWWFIRNAPELVWHRLALGPMLLSFQFGPALARMMGWFGLLAVLLSLRHLRPPVFLALAAIAHLYVALMYRAPQTVEYALPTWTLAACLFGIGFGRLYGKLRNEGGRVLDVLSMFASLLLLFIGFVTAAEYAVTRLPAFWAIARENRSDVAARGLLASLPDDALLQAQWHQATPLWALQEIEGLRPDVEVSYEPPAGAQPYAETFAQRAREKLNASGQPLFVTSHFPIEFAAAGLCSEPLVGQDAWRISPCPLRASRERSPALAPTEVGVAPTEVGVAVFDGRIALQSARLERRNPRVLDVTIEVIALGTWRPGDSLSVRLMQPDGSLGANVDFALDPATRRDERIVLRKRMGLPMPYDGAATMQRRIEALAYRDQVIYTSQDGVTSVALSDFEEPQPIGLPPRGTVFGGEMLLESATVSRINNYAIVDLDWRALANISSDYIVSVRLDGDEFFVAQDGVPALGALHTLKWIEGSRVADRHVIDTGDYFGPLRGTVVVYDSVTQLELPITSGAFDGSITEAP